MVSQGSVLDNSSQFRRRAAAKRRCCATEAADDVKVLLVSLDPHEASEKVEALRRLDLGLLEQHAILLECFYDVRVVVGELLLRIRTQQRAEGNSGGICHSE